MNRTAIVLSLGLICVPFSVNAYPAACSYSNFKSKIAGDRERCEAEEFDGGVRFRLKDRTVTIHYGESQGTWSRRKLNGQSATFAEENREAFSGTTDDLNEVFEYDSNPSALAKLPRASSGRRELPSGVKGRWVANPRVCVGEQGIYLDKSSWGEGEDWSCDITAIEGSDDNLTLRGKCWSEHTNDKPNRRLRIGINGDKLIHIAGRRMIKCPE